MGESSKLIIAIVVTAIIVGAGAYMACPGKVKEVQVPGDNQQPAKEKVKVGIGYTGPIGDFGYVKSHHVTGTQYLNQFDWIETEYIESVATGDVKSTIQTLVEEKGCDAYIGTTIEHSYPMQEIASQYPDTIFMGIGTHEEILEPVYNTPNMGLYWTDLWKGKYLNGIAAAALAESNKIGYIVPFLEVDPARTSAAFLLGAQEIKPNINYKIIKIGAWYDPGAATSAANTLIDWGADGISMHTNSPAPIEACQKHYEETDDKVYSFSHMGDMLSQGEDVVVSGSLAWWGSAYFRAALLASKGMTPGSEKYLWYDGISSDLEPGRRAYGFNGCDPSATWTETFNPEIVDELKNTMVDTEELGEVSAYEYIMYKKKQLEQGSFYPWQGPIYNNEGEVEVPEGQAIDKFDLDMKFTFWMGKNTTVGGAGG